MRQLSGQFRPKKYLTDIHPSNIWGVYNPKIFDGCMSVKHLWGPDPKIYDGCMSVKYLTDAHASVIRGG